MPRVTFTLPEDVNSDIEVLSLRLGCTSSALVALLVSERVSHFEDLIEDIRATTPEEVEVKRARGDSKLLIHERYRELLDEFELTPDY